MPDRQLTATDVPSSRPTARPGGAGRGATCGQSPLRRVKGRGNVGQLVRASDRSLVARYEYDPYGNTITATGPIAATNPFRFSTKWWDTETGLGYWGYRYYSPRLGRWMSRDPIEERGGLNLYTSMANAALVQVDTDGRGLLACCKCLWGLRKAAKICEQNVPKCDDIHDPWEYAECMRQRGPAIQRCISVIAQAMPDCQKCAWFIPKPTK